MPKELLPIIDKPLIQYAAEEAISAGIDTLIFVTGRNKRSIEDHFDANLELEAALIEKGKITEAKMVRNIVPKHVECIFVRQPDQLGLGHAILCAERVIGDGSFAVILADDFIRSKGLGVTNDLIKAHYRTDKNILSVMPVAKNEVSKYGILDIDNNDGSVKALIEKPSINDAPSCLASIGRYVLKAEVFNILRKLEPGFGGEIQLADAINVLAKKNKVAILKLNGKRYDCGSKSGYMDAIISEAGVRSE
jgi:UTP--glucose-1-phosphate uridylyltransferase